MGERRLVPRPNFYAGHDTLRVHGLYRALLQKLKKSSSNERLIHLQNFIDETQITHNKQFNIRSKLVVPLFLRKELTDSEFFLLNDALFILRNKIRSKVKAVYPQFSDEFSFNLDFYREVFYQEKKILKNHRRY